MEIVAGEIAEIAHAASDSLAGPVRIATTPLLADHFFVPALPELRQRFPQVEFELYSGVARRTGFPGGPCGACAVTISSATAIRC
ncbi:MAG: LysR substrate-binding domain-containing protein [Pseudomonadota bacterium]